MPTQTARKFRLEIIRLRLALDELSPALADVPWREGGWTRKQIVGHLLDSAANNRQRFVRAAIDGQYSGPGYAQDAWVAAHGYTRRILGNSRALVAGRARNSHGLGRSHPRRSP